MVPNLTLNSSFNMSMSFSCILFLKASPVFSNICVFSFFYSKSWSCISMLSASKNYTSSYPFGSRVAPALERSVIKPPTLVRSVVHPLSTSSEGETYSTSLLACCLTISLSYVSTGYFFFACFASFIAFYNMAIGPRIGKSYSISWSESAFALSPIHLE